MKPEDISPLSHYQMRTTGEPVFVVTKYTDDEISRLKANGFFQGEFQVVRPVQTKDGIEHRRTTVYAEELETPIEAQRRELDLMVEREVYMQQKHAQLSQTPAPTPVKPN